MIVFPNCKINLGLKIIGKRADGYHNIGTVFYPVPITDALEIVDQADQLQPGVLLALSGIYLNGDQKDNLCVKAWQLLKKDFPQLPDVNIHLHKVIPTGAGLGGGSADAAFTLIAMNEKYRLAISKDGLLHYALQSGSDCPFFIINQPCIATGRGEIIRTIDISLSRYYLILVNPGIHINTGWAFDQLKIDANYKDAEAIDLLLSVILQPVTEWKHQLVNEFEEPVFERFPLINNIKQELYQKGALYASMSGSGSTVYGIFDKNTDGFLNFPDHFWIRTVLL